jgi:Nidogen-like/Carboxypeptidase regulatory-like domain/HYR domain
MSWSQHWRSRPSPVVATLRALTDRRSGKRTDDDNSLTSGQRLLRRVVTEAARITPRAAQIGITKAARAKLPLGGVSAQTAKKAIQPTITDNGAARANHGRRSINLSRLTHPPYDRLSALESRPPSRSGCEAVTQTWPRRGTTALVALPSRLRRPAYAVSLLCLIAAGSMFAAPVGAAAAAQPPLTYHGGSVMQTTTNHLIFWLPPTLQDGTSAQVPADYVSSIKQFFNDESGSSLYNTYTQYCQGAQSGVSSCPSSAQFVKNSATYGGALLKTEAYPSSTDCVQYSNCVSDGTIQNLIRNAISGSGWSTGLADAFFVFLAPGEATCNRTDCLTATGCNAEHDFFHLGLAGTGPEAIYAKIPYRSCSIPSGPHSQSTDIAISFASHEQAEMITDPDNGGWWGSSNATDEIGDRCAGTAAPANWNGHVYLLQLEWSNLSNGCVPGEPNHPPELKPTTASAITSLSGCTANTLPANDDGSTAAVSLPFPVNFFGTTYQSLFVNNNGNVTFNGPLPTYTPFGLLATNIPMIAPFFADVDTRGPFSGLVTYGSGVAGSMSDIAYFCVNWVNVGYFSGHTDLVNSFQLVLFDASSATGTPGDFEIIFNYNEVKWETGDASGGTNGFGGASAHVGYSNGSTQALELPGSGANGALVDGGLDALAQGSANSATPGSYIFNVRNGTAPTGGRVFGTVTDDSSPPNPISGASIQVCNPAIGSCSLTNTNPAGGYSVAGLADASYYVTASPPSAGLAQGYAGPLAVTSGSTTRADMQLHSVIPIPNSTTISHHSVNATGTPVLDWRVPTTITTHSCFGGSATVQLVATNSQTHTQEIHNYALVETPPNSGTYRVTVPPLRPLAGAATFTMTIACLQPPPLVFSFSVYIDPSGVVVNQNGTPLPGATVTLLRSDLITGPFAPVPAGSTLMSPANRANPDMTAQDGRFGWDVLTGFYQIAASAAGCAAPGNPNQLTVLSPVFAVPPPINDLSLTLSCAVTDTDLALARVPAPITVNAAGPSGAVVTYSTPTAIDEEAPPPVVCNPPSGSTFAIGTTTVTCSLTDRDDTPATVSQRFTVTVRGAGAQIRTIINRVAGLEGAPIVRKSLLAVLHAAQTAVSRGSTRVACATMGLFTDVVQTLERASAPFRIPPAKASVLIAESQQVRATLGC